MSNDSKVLDITGNLVRIKDEMYIRNQQVTREQKFLSQRDKDYLELRRTIGEVNTSWATHNQIALTSPRPYIGWFVTAIKKILHRLFRFQMNAVDASMQQQAAFNMATAKGLSMLVERLEILDAIARANEARIHRANSPLPGEAAQSERKTGLPTSVYNGHGINNFNFKLRFGGTPEEVKERLSIYSDYYKNADNVLDIGCGCGEFLELLRDNGIEGIGIDTNPYMIEYCRNRSLLVYQADAIQYLESVKDGSLGGIFSSRVIEYFEPGYLAEMLNLCFDKLKPGGALIVETVNPTTLLALIDNYYLDPSHTKPIHPETLPFLLNEAGFTDICIRLSAPTPPEAALKRIELAKASDKEAQLYSILNDNIDRLNRQLYWFQYYAAIATKSK